MPFVALPTDRRTKYLPNRWSFMRGICSKRIGAIFQLGAEKITFPPKPDGHTDIQQTDRRTDICFYRVALLLKSKSCHFTRNSDYPDYLDDKKTFLDKI